MGHCPEHSGLKSSEAKDFVAGGAIEVGGRSQAASSVRPTSTA
jgi:hypothetical protein